MKKTLLLVSLLGLAANAYAKGDDTNASTSVLDCKGYDKATDTTTAVSVYPTDDYFTVVIDTGDDTAKVAAKGELDKEKGWLDLGGEGGLKYSFGDEGLAGVLDYGKASVALTCSYNGK